MTEDEMVGWHHQLNEHEFEQIPGESNSVSKLHGSQRVRHSLATKQQYSVVI